MKNKGVDKGLAAAGTIMFVGLIQTGAEPPFWFLAALSLALYEVCLWCCRIARKEAYQERKSQYIAINKLNGKRLEEARVGWPMKELDL